MGRLRHLRPTDRRVLRGAAAVPDSWGGRRVTGHRVTGVGTVLQGNFTVFVKFLELGSPVLEPDLDL